MMYRQVFKTREGAEKRAAFENAHAKGRYRFFVVRYKNGSPDPDEYVYGGKYEYRLWRVSPRDR